MITSLRDAGVALGVQPPFQDIALDDEGVDHFALLRTLCRGANVDQERAAAQRGGNLVGGQAPQPTTRGGQQIMHRHAAGPSGSSVRMVRLRRNVLAWVTS
ncbi:Uncharacterised protein [Mycobacteroides abscessus subsp. massiliense]|nr:Uncharacterised protein [Mycobacteroides abscessus subsp. massiliense]